MTKKYLQLLTLSLIIALSLTLAGMALAQTWQPPQNTTPPGCTAGDDGCYVPINVSNKAQTKKGGLTIEGLITGLNGIILKNNSFVDGNFNFIGNEKFIRFSKTMDETLPTINSNDGKIGRLTGSDNLNNRKVLDIIGVRQDPTDTYRSPNVKDRLVRIWDNLTVSGTTTTSNLYAKNYYICTEAGSCTKFEGGGGDSLWENIAGTAKVVLKALPTAGRVMVGIGNNNPTVDLEVGSPTHTTPAYVGVRSATNNYAGYRWANGDKNIWWLYKPANNNTEGVPAESLVLGNNTVSGVNVATPKVVFTSGAGGANAYVMDVKGSAKATSLSADTIVALNPSPSSNPTNTGLVLANSPVNEDHVLYVQGSPAGGSTLRNVFLKPVSQIGGGVLGQFWNKVSGQEEITYTGRIGIAGANDPPVGVDLAIGANTTGLKASSTIAGLSLVTNGVERLSITSNGTVKIPATKQLCLGDDCRSSWVWRLIGGEASFPGSIGIAGANDPSNSIDLAIGSDSSGLKADDGAISIVTSGNKHLTVSRTANSNFNVGIGTESSTALSVPGTGIFSNGVALGGNSLVKSGKEIRFYTPDDSSYGRTYSTASSLSLVGVGTSPNRLIRLYDTASTTNLIANNICTAVGSCTSVSNIVNNTTGFWTEADNRTGLFYPGSIGLKGAENPNSNLAVAVGGNTTGLGSSASNVLDFWTNGVVRLSLSSDGKVQIPAGKQLCLGADCRTSWPVASVASNIWTLITGEARPEAYFDGSIGIAGAGNPNSQIDLAIGGSTTGLKYKQEGATKFLSLFTDGRERIKTGGGKTTHNGTIDLFGNLNTYDANRNIGGTIETGNIRAVGQITVDRIVPRLIEGGTARGLTWLESDAVEVRTICFKDYNNPDNCKSAWPTGAGSTGSISTRIYCEFNSAGNATGGCPDATYNTAGTHKNYLLSCPSNYRIVSGGAWCDSNPPVYMGILRENRPASGGAWKASCVRQGATGVQIEYESIGGASIICER